MHAAYCVQTKSCRQASGELTLVLLAAYAARTTEPTDAATSVVLLAATAMTMLLAASVKSLLEFEDAAASSEMGLVTSTPCGSSTLLSLQVDLISEN